jgi:hypothetical protein
MDFLEFLKIDGDGNIVGFTIYEPDFYSSEEIQSYYQQLDSFLLYKKLLYDKAVNNKVNISNISNLLSQYTDSKDRLFMKKVIETLIYLNMARRDSTDSRSLYLDSDQYKFEKEYLLKLTEDYILNFCSKISLDRLKNDDDEFNIILKTSLYSLQVSIRVLEYLNDVFCNKRIDRLCPFIESLILVARGYLDTYVKPESSDEYYKLGIQPLKFVSFYRFVRSIDKYTNNKDVVIISLGPGTNISEYLPDYALELEEKGKKVIILAYEPIKEDIPDPKLIFRQYPAKRKRLFGNNNSPNELYIEILNNKVTAPNMDTELPYLVTATKILVEAANALTEKKLVLYQCGIAPSDCENIYNLLSSYGLKIDGYLIVRGTVVGDLIFFQVINKQGETVLKNSQKDMKWEQISSLL